MAAKIIKIFLAFIVVSFLCALGLLYWSQTTGPESLPNRVGGYILWRFPIVEYAVLYHPQLRDWLGFHFAGDDHLDYLTQHHYNKILIEVDYAEDFSFSKTSLEHLKKLLEECCPKRDGVEIVVDDEMFNIPSVLSQEEVGSLAKTFRDFPSKDEIKVLHLLGLTKSPRLAGGTCLGPDTFAVFFEEINEISKYPIFLDLNLKAVLTHELGHLLGLRHNNNLGCAMHYLFHSREQNFDEWAYVLYQSLSKKLGEKEALSQLGIMYGTQFCEEEIAKLEKAKSFPSLIRRGKCPGTYYYWGRYDWEER